MTLVRNEQTKLTATFLNGIGVAVFAVGGLAPVFSSLYTENGPPTFTLIMSVICFCAAMCLHWTARIILRRLEP